MKEKLQEYYPSSIQLYSKQMQLFDDAALSKIEKLARNYKFLLKHYEDILTDPNMYFCNVGLKFNALGCVEDKIVLGDLLYLLKSTPWGQAFDRITLAVAGGENDAGIRLYYDTHRGRLDVSLETKGFTDKYLIPAFLAILIRYKTIIETDFNFYAFIPMTIEDVLNNLKRKDDDIRF